MLIEIPVTICFDHDTTWRLPRSDTSRTFTMRYDTTQTDVPAQFCDHYPPRPNAQWIADKDGILFTLFTQRAERFITRRAEIEPESYRAKEAA